MSKILNNLFIPFLCVGFALLVGNNIQAQEKYAKEYEKQGDKAMQEKQYQQAYDYYILGRKFVKKDTRLLYKSAEACLAMEDYDKAEYCYQKILIENDSANINQLYPYLYLHLAQSSLSNGNIIQAQSFLNTCLLDCNDMNIRQQCKDQLKRIDWINENDEKLSYDIINLGSNINDEVSQMNTFILKDSLFVYTTSTYKTKTKKGKTYYKNVYQQLFCSFMDENYYTQGKKLPWGKINKKKRNVTDLFFDTVTLTAYFTYAKKDGLPAIYYSQFNDKKNKWTKPKIFEPLKEDKKHSYCHPIVARHKNETLLYFASDREKGQGKMDIWFLDLNNKNSKPINCGDKINTEGNEITPFYDQNDQMLYFSSDTHEGFGGFDIFRTKGWKTLWYDLENLYQPINSPANDMYPYICSNSAGNKGYFTSNRPSTFNKENKTCCNDIYRFEYFDPKSLNDENIFIDSTKIINNSNKFVQKRDLPLKLYFHNDSPEPGSELSSTDKDYGYCYKEYLSLTNSYKANRTKGLTDSLAQERLAEIDSFMKNKLQYGYDKLNQFLDYLIVNLQANQKITIEIRGYASSLFETNYNQVLSIRRIKTIENYMRLYKGGILSAYMDNIAMDNKPLLQIISSVIGKQESTSPNPSELELKRQSIYLPESMLERKVEITTIQFR